MYELNCDKFLFATRLQIPFANISTFNKKGDKYVFGVSCKLCLELFKVPKFDEWNYTFAFFIIETQKYKIFHIDKIFINTKKKKNWVRKLERSLNKIIQILSSKDMRVILKVFVLKPGKSNQSSKWEEKFDGKKCE